MSKTCSSVGKEFAGMRLNATVSAHVRLEMEILVAGGIFRV